MVSYFFELGYLSIIFPALMYAIALVTGSGQS